MHTIVAEEVGHNFRGMCILLSRIIYNELFLLTQRVDLGCVGVHCGLARAYGKRILIRICDQPPLSMHDHLLTVHSSCTNSIKIVHWHSAHAQMKAVAEATPLGKASKCAMATFSLCSNVATDY